MLVVAVVNQIANTITDKGHEIAGITSYRLLSADMPNGILYGPYSPKYHK
ncbi:GNA1162 family protein [Aeromonas salmonicida]